MAVDDQEKRMSASGAGRPYKRGKLPGANDQEWRISSGNAYGGNPITGLAVVLIAQARGVFRFIRSRAFGRVN